MKKLQIIVTSYQRLIYLKATVFSLKRKPGMPIEIYIVDGGSDAETRKWILKNSTGCVFLEDNPGADVLKNTGIGQFVTEPVCMMSSDDLYYPDGYAQWAVEQYERLNAGSIQGKPNFTFVACCMDYIEKMVSAGSIAGDTPRTPRRWQSVRGVDILRCSTSQVAGALLDKAVWRQVGGFPVYGKSGQGDHAISKRIRELGIQMCYLRRPLIRHLGARKYQDYPSYAANFDRDEAEWRELAELDALRGSV